MSELQGRLQDRVALITGGSSGIGAETARLFAQEGARILIAARRTEQAAAIVAAITAAGGQAASVVCDVRHPDDCARAVEQATEIWGRLDIVFNNAGVVRYATLEETTDEVWLDSFATNVHGTFYITRAAMPVLVAGGGGVVINNASDWAVVGGQGALAYCATKGAIAQMTRSLALDYGRHGVRVNAIAPGDTYVERWVTEHPLQPGETLDERLAQMGEPFALGRVGQVSEIARAVLFLASDDSSYMTGQLLIVDGGNTAGGASVRY